MTVQSLDEKVLAVAVSARQVMDESADEYTVHEAHKLLRACDEYFMFQGSPEAKFTRRMLQSYQSHTLSKQMELTVEGEFEDDD